MKLELVTKSGEGHGKVTLTFEFEGDFKSVYGGFPLTEEEARQWVVLDVRDALEAGAALKSQGQADAEDRGDS